MRHSDEHQDSSIPRGLKFEHTLPCVLCSEGENVGGSLNPTPLNLEMTLYVEMSRVDPLTSNHKNLLRLQCPISAMLGNFELVAKI